MPATNPETITIDTCPVCGESHRYSLDVQRSSSLAFVTSVMHGDTETPRKVRFTRVISCPKKNEKYEVVFVLTDTSADRIKEVAVLGPANEPSG